MAKLVDPVEAGKKEQELGIQLAEEAGMSIDALTLDDFQPIPTTANRQPHPFEGYPQRKIKIGTYKEFGKEKELIVNATHIVALNPKEFVFQDRSGQGVEINFKEGGPKIVNLETFHSRVVRDQMGKNTVIVFDRKITLGDGKSLDRCSICPDHTARAQLMFKVNPKTGKVEVDNRYLLADTKQVSRLRELFNRYFFQQTQSERLAAKFDAEQESKAN
jgi:hypothetical protein